MQPTEDLLDLVVAEREVSSSDVLLLRLVSADGSPLPAWDPGAHIDVRTPAGIRHYSLCGPLSERRVMQIGVQREIGGRGGSLHLHEEIQVGDHLAVSRPRNNFRIIPSSSYLFVAGGIGITPMMPMIEAAEAMGSSWRLLYLARTSDRFVFADRLGKFGDRVRLVPTREGATIDLEAELRIASDPEIYCCGPDRLIEDLEAIASAQGCGERFHAERFAADGSVRGDARPFRITCARSALDLEVPAASSALDVLLANDIFVPTSCMEGICGSCETGVLGGVPLHRDSILSPRERAANDRMYVCVSRAETDRLVLDL